MDRSIPFLLSSLFLILPNSAPSKETGQSVQESAEAILVEVPVRVVDRAGKPIHGLTAGDFEIFDDGKKQSITSVDIVDLAAKTPEAPALGDDVNPAARRHFLILFDLAFSGPKGISAAQRAAKEFVLSGMGDHDLAGVATFTLQEGLRLVANFSSDRSQLARAVETLGAPARESLKTDPLAFVYDSGRIQVNEKLKNAIAGAVQETIETFKALDRASVDRFSRTRVSQLTQSLGGLAVALDAVEGRKDVIFLSEGFESRLLTGTHDTDQERQWITEGDIWKIDSDKRFGSSTLLQEFTTLTHLFRRSDCIVHVVDVGGIATQSAIGQSQNTNVGPAENSLFELANETGGEVFRNANNFSGQFEKLLNRTSLVYVLAFRPQLSGHDGTFHELKVKVRASGARVSARAGYYESRSFGVLSPLERSLAAANVITQDKLQGDLPIQVIAIPFAEEGIFRVPVFLRISPESRLGAAAKDRLQLGIFVYVTNEKGELADYFTRNVAVDLRKENGELARGGLTYYGTCHLLSGRYRIRAYVRDEETGRFGFRALPVAVPELADGKLQAVPPIFVSEESGGLRLKEESGANPNATPEPLQVGGVFVVPQISPTVSSGHHSRICLMVYQKLHSESTLPLEITMSIVDSDGAARPAPRVSLLSRSTPEAEGLNKMILDFEPPSLPPGEYSLRVMFRDALDHGSHAESETLFRVL